MRRRRRGRLVRIIVRAAGLGILLLAAAILWLDQVGLPAAIQDRLRTRIRQSGIDADFTDLRLDLPDGIEAAGVRLFDGPAARQPRLSAGCVRVGVHWLNLLRRRPALGTLGVRDGQLLIGAADGASDSTFVDRIRADVRLVGDTLEVAAMSGSWRGLSIHAGGRIGLARGADGRLRPPALPAGARLPTGGSGAFSAGQLPLAFSGGGQIEVRFDLDAAAPDRAGLSFNGEGGKVTWGGVPFDGWTLGGRFAGGRIFIDEAAVRAGNQRTSVAATLDLAKAEAEVRLSGSMPSAHALNLPLPPHPDAARAALELRTVDPLRFDVTLGPAPWTSLAERVRGRVDVSKIEVLGIWLERMAATFERNGPRLTFSDIDGVVGRDAMAGPAHLQGSIDLPSGDYEGRAETRFDPHALLPWMDPVQSMHVGAVDFRSVPPRCTARATGSLGDIRRLVLSGTVEATNFVYNGAFVAAATARMQVSNETLRLDEIRAVRPEGELTGRIEQDFRHRMLTFDIDSALAPAAAARLCGPFPHRFVSHFRTEGPARIRARGRADYGNHVDNDATFSVDAHAVGMGWLLADRIAFDGRIRGRHIVLTNATGAIYGGTFAGNVAFDLPDGAEHRTHYDVAGRMDNLDFPSILRALTDRTEQTHEGRLSGTVALAGFIGVGQGHTAVGSGSMKIEHGRLLEIPIFGGFSRHIAKVIPGVAFTSQSDFRADFRIANGRVTTELADLQGDLLSMHGRGTYYFDRRLDFVVEAKLLRESLVADVIRLLTLPVTKLLEYDLEGTLTAPQWTPRNMPRELLPGSGKTNGTKATGP